MIGKDAIKDVKGAADQEVWVGIRPEGFVLDENGPLTCNLSRVEVMGRDISVVCTNEASENASIRAIIDSENVVDTDSDTVRFSVRPGKVEIFSKATEERIFFEKA